MPNADLDRMFPGYDKPLTAEEGELRDYFEGLVDAGLPTYLTVGWALQQIHDLCLWRDQSLSWKEYCANRWAMSRPYATQVIAASRMIAEMFPAYFPGGIEDVKQLSAPNETVAIATENQTSPKLEDYKRLSELHRLAFDAFPRNESQLRQLRKAPPELRGKIWETAKQKCEDGQPSARQIRDISLGIVADANLEPASGGNGSSVYRDLREGGEDDVTDFIGQPVPPHLVPIFRDGAAAFKSLREGFRSIRKQLEELAKSPAGARIQPGEVKQFVLGMKDFLSYAPHAVCPNCRGDSTALKTCRGCQFTGWLSRCVYRQMPPEKRAAMELRAEGAEVIDDDL